MARNVLLVAFGVVVGVLGGAALSIHAFDEGDTADAASPETDAPVVEDSTPQAAEPSYGVWDRLAACESTGNWHANTGNGFFGGVQFDRQTWLAYGGGVYAARADLASRAAQIAVAERLRASRGFAPWPVCSRRLGLR
jgi:hypothetical protein